MLKKSVSECASILFFKHVLSLRKSNLDIRPSVVAFELRVRFSLVIKMHAGNIKITPKHSTNIDFSVNNYSECVKKSI